MKNFKKLLSREERLIVIIDKLVATAKEKEITRIELAKTAKKLSLIASNKEIVRVDLVKTAKKLAVAIWNNKKIDELYKSTLTAIDDGIWNWDVPSGDAFFSKSYYKILGYKDNEFIANYKNWKILVHPDDIKRVENELQKAVAVNMGFDIPLRMKMKSGNWIWVATRGKAIKKDNNGNAVRMVGTLSDITERKNAELILEESNNLNETIIESIPGTFYMLDDTGKYVRWNRYQRDDIVGKGNKIKETNAIDTIYPGDRELIGSKIANVFKNGITELIEGRVLMRGGPEFKWLLMTGNRIIFKDKAFLVGIGIDITDRKKMEDRLKELDRLKDEFLSVTTHELKSPLLPIKSQSQLLLAGDYGKLNIDQQKAVEMIYRNGESLNLLTGDVLDITKINSNRFKLTLQKVDLEQIIITAINDIKNFGYNKQLDISLLPLPRLPVMKLDKFRIAQVLNNLLNNAIKFSQKNGKITIEAKLQNNKVIVKVKDTGIGIAKTDIDKLFVPFSQIDSSMSRKYRGTGLGLAISKGIIEAHSGKIWVESDGLGKGSSFIFSLPIINSIKSNDR